MTGTRAVAGRYGFPESGNVRYDERAGVLSFTANTGGSAQVPVRVGSFCQKS